MRFAAKILILNFWLLPASLGAAELTEQFSLAIPKTAPDMIFIRDGDLIHSGANSTKATAQGRRDVFRWIISARSSDQVQISIAAAEWHTLGVASYEQIDQQLYRVYAPQIWGELHIVVLEVDPWRVNNGTLEALVTGQVNVTINHAPQDRLVDDSRAKYPGTPVVNKIGVLRERTRSVKNLLSKSLEYPAGRWLKIPILEDNLYRITGSYLENANIDLTTIDSAEIRLYANRSMGRPVLAHRDSIMIAAMFELPALYDMGSDGTFETTDNITFYVPGPRGFKILNDAIVYEQNPYTDTAWVWLALDASDGRGGPLEITPGPTTNTALPSIDTGRGYVRREIDSFNGFESGLEWHQSEVSPSNNYVLEINTPNLITERNSSATISVRGGSDTDGSAAHSVAVQVNNTISSSTTTFSGFGDATIALDANT